MIGVDQPGRHFLDRLAQSGIAQFRLAHPSLAVASFEDAHRFP